MIELLNLPATDRPAAGARGAHPGEEDWTGDYHPDPGFFHGLSCPFGSLDLEVRVADASARLHGLSSRQRADLAARYGIFARPVAGAAVDVEVDLHRSPRPGFLKVGRAAKAEAYRLLMRREEGKLLAWSYEWASCCDFAAGRATLAIGDDERTVFDRSIENFLRVVFAHLALARGGFLLHGSGVVRDGRAFVFFGPSGSGKTTVTTLSKGSLVLSDDLILIARSGAGRFEACSVPFRGLVTPPATSDARYPLAGMFRLVQDERDYLEEISRPRAIGEIVQSLPFVTERPEATARALDAVGDLAGQVPVRRLHFRKDAEFWRIVENVR